MRVRGIERERERVKQLEKKKWDIDIVRLRES